MKSSGVLIVQEEWEFVRVERREQNRKSKWKWRKESEESINIELNALPGELKSVFQVGNILSNLTMRLTKPVKTELHFH